MYVFALIFALEDKRSRFISRFHAWSPTFIRPPRLSLHVRILFTFGHGYQSFHRPDREHTTM